MRRTKENPGAGDARVSEIVLDQQTTDGSHYSPLIANATTTPPFRSIGELAAEIVVDLAFRHRVRRLHARGPRLIAELLAELGAERAITTLIEQKIDRFLALDDAALDVTGGRAMPPAPLTCIDGRRQ